MNKIMGKLTWSVLNEPIYCNDANPNNRIEVPIKCLLNPESVNNDIKFILNNSAHYQRKQLYEV